MAGDYWNPKYWTAGNFYPDGGSAVESLAITATKPLFDAGSQRDTPGSKPGLVERSVGVDSADVAEFVTTSIGGADMWEDGGVNHLEVHFTTVDARNAYAQAVLNAPTDAAKAAVAQQYRDSAVGGYWGTVGVAL